MPFRDESEAGWPPSSGQGVLVRTGRAMASAITVQVPGRPARGRHGSPAFGRRSLERTVDRALGQFHSVERACSRFTPDSALARANRRPGRWHLAPEPLYAALREARGAYAGTSGLFDPRVHDRLVELGYDRSFHLILSEGCPPRSADGSLESGPQPVADWRPRFVAGLRLVNLGGRRIDLGGIGKGMALARAAALLSRSTRHFLVDAGGDLYAAGSPGPTAGWRIGVESPSGEEGHVAVLELSDRAVATSSVRVRQWNKDGRRVHHLIDPRTGEPGGHGLASVTVVHPDPVTAETRSKVLFLAGPGAIGAVADRLGLAVLWVDASGSTGLSSAMAPFVTWLRS